jgi:hypothetical protein
MKTPAYREWPVRVSATPAYRAWPVRIDHIATTTLRENEIGELRRDILRDIRLTLPPR